VLERTTKQQAVTSAKQGADQVSQTFRLLRSALPVPHAPALDQDQQRVVDHRGAVLRVLAGPGTGKTTSLVESVVNRVEQRGVPIEQILLLTFSRAAAGELRDRVTARLQRTVSEPVARTFHSYAFGLVRQAAVLRGDPPLRLLSSSERDITLRELLAGRLDAGFDDWPPELAAAVRTRAFVDELSDLLMRAVERDLRPADLEELGLRHGRRDWVAAAGVLTEYLQVTSLQAPGAFDAAELIQRAIGELHSNTALLNSERGKRRRIFVDEYQDTDPSQTELLRLIGAGADEMVLIGDPDQSIYSFRGADSYAMSAIDRHFGTGAEAPTVSLSVCRRSGPDLLAATRRLAARLPGPVGHRQLTAAPGLAAGAISVALFSSSSQEAAYLATRLRRAHFEDGIPWSAMAVLVRAVGPGVDTLRRGLAVAGVPVGQSVRGPLTDEPVVGQLLGLLQCIARPEELSIEVAESLLTGPIGGADPLQITRMYRYLRRLPSGALPITALLTEPAAMAFLPPALQRSVERVRAVIQTGQTAASSGSAEDVLWAVWHASDLSHRLERRSLSGGADGARADRDLDAVLALFAEAAKVSDRSPGSGIEQLRQWVSLLQITDSSVVRTPGSAEVVTITTAHASKGLEWDVVCLAGVAEGVWPNLRQRGSLLGADLLVDICAARPPQTAGLVAERLHEERRLFYVAATRARRALLVTALDTEDSQPSRFLDELDPVQIQRPLSSPPQRFVLAGVLAELRAVVVDPTMADEDRRAAATELARLAKAGADGAHPDDWWGLLPPSTDAPIRHPDAGPVPILPSKFEAYLDCELKALLTELGARDSTDESAASLGTLVHAIAEQAPADATVSQLVELLDEGWRKLQFAAPWHGVRERARAHRMLETLVTWLTRSRDQLALVAVEEPFRVEVGDAVLSGKVDRLERDRAGRLVVIDLKTGKSKPSADDVASHAQLAAYQLAIAEGAFATSDERHEPGGARLVQLGAQSPGEQVQAPMSDFDDPQWVRTELARVAAVLRGRTVTARVGKACPNCPVKLSCPAQDAGRPVTS
jgi:superfamily I DNA/RNA helicase/RecB family exonuclease